ncbi:hypothetical protein [Streptomyces sp. t39]|uniref:hypothetical protein n=1 Tax=Streptomyces sp. t39 TaxID=1828156 RepID=UPI0011CE272D|nr:hypothetical protein [Streptomyces sp. t39]TXS47866.1 hypothetical protein EAO77_31780 [Streptomyces sp. t39]
MKTRRAVLATGALCALLAVPAHSGQAWADETHRNAHNGSQFSLVRTGQIDDPLEDVLEHAAILGSSTTTSDTGD